MTVFWCLVVGFIVWAMYQIGHQNGWCAGWDDAKGVFEPDIKRWRAQAVEYRIAFMLLETKPRAAPPDSSSAAPHPEGK